MPLSQARVAHIGVAVSDLDEAAAFYRDVLGLEPAQPETADGARIVSVELGDVEIELLAPEVPDSPIAKFMAKRGPGIHHICYRVPDLERALENVKAGGGIVLDEREEHDFGRFGWFVDPDGNRVELWQAQEAK